MTDEPETTETETPAAETEPESKPEAKAKGKAKAAPAPDPLEVHLEGAQADGLTGVSLVFHELELGFCHALAGAEKEAEECIDRADAEVEKHAPHLSHLARDFHLRKARIYAALSRK